MEHNHNKRQHSHLTDFIVPGLHVLSIHSTSTDPVIYTHKTHTTFYTRTYTIIHTHLLSTSTNTNRPQLTHIQKGGGVTREAALAQPCSLSTHTSLASSGIHTYSLLPLWHHTHPGSHTHESRSVYGSHVQSFTQQPGSSVFEQ